MTHLLTILFFLALVGAAGTMIVQLIREDAERIAGALLRLAPAEAKPWPARVRMVSMRPSATQRFSRRATA